VQLAVPRDLQKTVGKSLLTQSLGTRDKAEANRRKLGIVAEWVKAFGEFRNAPMAPPQVTPHAILRIARDMHAEITAGTLPSIDAVLSLDEAIDVLRARDPTLETPDADPVSLDMIERAQRALHGQLGPTLRDEVEVFLKERSGDVTAQTLDDLKRRLGEFLRWIDGDTEVTKVDRRLAGRYLTEVIQKKPVSPVTRTKDVSAVRTFFGWLLDRGVVELNPFDKMAKTVKASTRGKERGVLPSFHGLLG